MTLIEMCGFEQLKKRWVVSSATWGLASGRTSKCLQCSSNSANVLYTLPSPEFELVIGFAMRFGGGSNTVDFFKIASAGGVEMSMGVNSALNVIRIHRGDGTTFLVDANPVYQILPTIWYYYEMKYKVDNSTGYWEIWQNNNLIISFTGDTRQSAASTGITTIYFAGRISDDYRFDDFYMCNTVDATATQGRPFNNYLGPVKIEALRPNGNGALNQWVGSDGNSTDNYLLTDEDPPNITDYTSSSTNGQRDLYTMTDIVTPGTVYALDLNAYIQSPDSGTSKGKPMFRDTSGTVIVDPGIVPGLTFQNFNSDIITKDPNGVVLNTAIVNALQMGIEINV